MKHIITFCLFYLILLIPAVTKSQTKPSGITGTWQLISSKGSINSIPIDHDSSTVYMLKILTASMFVNTEYDKKTNHFKSTTQGIYSITGDQYNETVTNSSVGDFPGHGFVYTYSIVDNILTIQGESNGIKLLESWKRIE